MLAKIKPTKILGRDLGLRSLPGYIGIGIYSIESAESISMVQDYAVLETLSAVRVS